MMKKGEPTQLGIGGPGDERAACKKPLLCSSARPIRPGPLTRWPRPIHPSPFDGASPKPQTVRSHPHGASSIRPHSGSGRRSLDFRTLVLRGRGFPTVSRGLGFVGCVERTRFGFSGNDPAWAVQILKEQSWI